MFKSVYYLKKTLKITSASRALSQPPALFLTPNIITLFSSFQVLNVFYYLQSE